MIRTKRFGCRPIAEISEEFQENTGEAPSGLARGARGSSRRSQRSWGQSQPQSWMTRADTCSKSPHEGNPPSVGQAIAVQAASVKDSGVNAPAAAPTSSVERLEGHAGARAALALGALGVVFGDIGTSPLYALQTVFRRPASVPPTSGQVFGVISLVFWSITIIVSVKYVIVRHARRQRRRGRHHGTDRADAAVRCDPARSKLG